MTVAGSLQDITVAGFEAVYPAQPAHVADIRREVIDAARRCGAVESTVAKIRLGVSEAASNAIVHAYRDGAAVGDIHICVTVTQAHAWLCVSVRDWGVGMSPRLDSPGAGLGLSMMATVAESCEIRSPADGGTEIIMRFELG